MFIILFLAVLGLPCYADFSLLVESGGYFLAAVAMLGLTTMACLVAASGLWSRGSVVVVHGLSCSVAWGILDQGLNLCLLHWQVGSLPLSHQGSPGVHYSSSPPTYYKRRRVCIHFMLIMC